MLKQWLTVKKASQSVHGYAIYLYIYILYNDLWQKSMEMGNGAEGKVKERMG